MVVDLNAQHTIRIGHIGSGLAEALNASKHVAEGGDVGPGGHDGFDCIHRLCLGDACWQIMGVNEVRNRLGPVWQNEAGGNSVPANQQVGGGRSGDQGRGAVRAVLGGGQGIRGLSGQVASGNRAIRSLTAKHTEQGLSGGKF